MIVYFTCHIGGMKRRDPSEPRHGRDSLHVEVGGWFRAHATGLGVLAIPVILMLLALILLGGTIG